MPTRYVSLNSEFSMDVWGAALQRECDEHGQEFVAAYLGVSQKTVFNWITKSEAAYREFPHPHMTNFLKFCNAFGYDPRDFFKLGE